MLINSQIVSFNNLCDQWKKLKYVSQKGDNTANRQKYFIHQSKTAIVKTETLIVRYVLSKELANST